MATLQEQVDAIQLNNNLNFPLRSIFYRFDNSIINSYDGDPNDPGADAVLQNAAPGTEYQRSDSRYYRKRTSSATSWTVEIGPQINAEPFTLYVRRSDDANPGDDANDGLSATTAIETLDEMQRRIPLNTAVTVNMGVGEFPIKDYFGEGLGSALRFMTFGKAKIEGATSVNQTVTITGATDNVATVSDTLISGALVGLIYADTITFPGFTLRFWVIANTTNQITFALNPPTWGGFASLPTSGTMDLLQLDTVIAPSPTFPNFSANQFKYGGNPIFSLLHFDGSAGGGGGAGGPLSDAAAGSNRVALDGATFQNCRISGYSSNGLSNAARDTINGCLLQGSGSAEGAQSGFFTGNTVLMDWDIGIRSRGQNIQIGINSTIWNAGNNTLMYVSEGGIVTDRSKRVWIGGIADGFAADPKTHLRALSFCQYAKPNTPLIGEGLATYDKTFVVHTGSGDIGLNLSFTATASITSTTAYVELEANTFHSVISLTEAQYKTLGSGGTAFLVEAEPAVCVWD